MSKVLKPLAILGAIAINVIPGAGQAISAAILGSTLATTAVVTGVTVGGIFAATLSAGLLMLGAPGAPKSAGSLSDLDRLNLSQVASAPRKFVFGETAFASDLRYTEPSGDQQRFVDAIVHLASHKIQSLDRVYINDELAWTAAGGAQGIYAGYLTISVIKEGGAGATHAVTGGSKWGAAQRLTGAASIKLRIDRKAQSKNSASPFAGGLPGNMRFVGKGAYLYDPRRDSTKGGAGSHRADDCSTWAWADGATVLGENIALQALAWLLGWRVNGEVVCGLGLPPETIDFDAFAVAANACDEAIALAAGGTQPRFWGGGLVADNTDPNQVMQDFALACGGRWDDSSGRLGLTVAVNDLAGALPAITDDDILGEVQWLPFAAQPVNVVRGQNPDPSGTALYQPSDYPEVRHPEFVSGRDVERAATVNLAFVQDKRRAERIARQVFQRQQYQGRLQFRCGLRAWQLHRGDVVRLTFAQLGFAAQLFRVIGWTANMDGSVDLTLLEEHPAIYAWDRAESPTVAPAVPVYYDPRNAPGARQEPVAWGDVIDDGGKPTDGATRNVATVIDEDFSSYASLSDVQHYWELSGGTANFQKGNYSTYSGGALLECIDYVTAKWRELLPYNPEDLYVVELEAWIDNPGVGATLYLGIECFDGDRVKLVAQADSGSYAYSGGQQALNAGNHHTMVRLFGYFRGRALVGAGNGVGSNARDPSRPSPLADGTLWMRPVLLAAYHGATPGDGGSNVRLNRARLAKVEDLTTLPARAWSAGDWQRAGQLVTHAGRTWIARVSNIGQQPPATAVGNATWGLVADKPLVDGVTIGDNGGIIGVRPGGINTPEIKTNAVNMLAKFDHLDNLTTPSPLTVAWADVKIALGGVATIVQVTATNSATTPAEILIDFRGRFFEYNSQKFQLRLHDGVSVYPIRQFDGSGWGAGFDGPENEACAWSVTLAAGTTRTFTLQGVVSGWSPAAGGIMSIYGAWMAAVLYKGV